MVSLFLLLVNVLKHFLQLPSYISLKILLCVIVRHHNIRNGIVWVQATALAHIQSRCMWLNFEHTKNSNRSKQKFSQRRNSNSNLLINSKNTRNRSKLFRAAKYTYIALEEGDSSDEQYVIREALKLINGHRGLCRTCALCDDCIVLGRRTYIEEGVAERVAYLLRAL